MRPRLFYQETAVLNIVHTLLYIQKILTVIEKHSVGGSY